MNTLFGNNAVNNHTENKSADNGSFQNSNFNNNYSRTEETPVSTYQTSDSPTSSAEPIDIDNLPDFRSIEYKDGHVDSPEEEWIDRKKCTMAEIAGKPIIIRGIYERTSKLYDDGSKYISINFVDLETKEECYVTSSGNTIRKQIAEKNMQYPFKATIKACPKKDNPNMKYYKLT